jgi:beta-lactamase class A
MRRVTLLVAAIVAMATGASVFAFDDPAPDTVAPVVETISPAAPPAAPTLIPSPESTAGPPPAPTLIPPPATGPASASNVSQLQADLEAAMQAIVPNGSAELIARGGTLVARYRASEPRVAASTIKLSLLIELLREAETGDVDLSKTVTIQRGDVVGGTGDLQFQVGRTLTLDDLARLMVTRSDNVAANLLVDTVGMPSVNRTAAANNFPNTFFRRHMLDIAAQAAGIENVTTAEDLAGMVHAIVRDELISPAVSEKAQALLSERGRIDKDWLGLNLPAGAQLMHINGTLTGVRNDVGLISGPDGTSFVLAVCQDHLANEAAGEAAIARLARRAYDILSAG